MIEETYGPNLIVDGDMESQNANAWAVYGSPVVVEKSTVQKHNGTRSLHIVGDTTNDGVKQSPTVEIGEIYELEADVYLVSGQFAVVQTNAGGGYKNLGAVDTTGQWTHVLGRVKASATSPKDVRLITYGAAEIYFDNLSFRKVTIV